MRHSGSYMAKSTTERYVGFHGVPIQHGIKQSYPFRRLKDYLYILRIFRLG